MRIGVEAKDRHAQGQKNLPAGCLRAGLLAFAAYIAASSGAHANAADLAAVSDSVSSAVAPVAEKTAAFIPGTAPAGSLPSTFYSSISRHALKKIQPALWLSSRFLQV